MRDVPESTMAAQPETHNNIRPWIFMLRYGVKEKALLLILFKQIASTTSSKVREKLNEAGAFLTDALLGWGQIQRAAAAPKRNCGDVITSVQLLPPPTPFGVYFF